PSGWTARYALPRPRTWTEKGFSQVVIPVPVELRDGGRSQKQPRTLAPRLFRDRPPSLNSEFCHDRIRSLSSISTLKCLSMRIFLLGALLLLSKGQAQTPTPALVSSGINFFSVKQDGEIGLELSRE